MNSFVKLQIMKRIFDLILAVFLLLIFFIPLLIIAVLVIATSKGPALYWSDRIGKNNKIFKMPKFRSMLTNTPAVATHLLDNPKSYLSPIGGLLRFSSLDELPQLFSVLKGDMSFIGPRPALFNQKELIAFRTENGVDKLLPGITGWAQVNGRNAISWEEKFKLDVWYVENRTFWLDIKILFLTVKKVFVKEGISAEGEVTMHKFTGSE